MVCQRSCLRVPRDEVTGPCSVHAGHHRLLRHLGPDRGPAPSRRRHHRQPLSPHRAPAEDLDARAYPVEYAYDPQGRMRTMTTWQNVRFQEVDRGWAWGPAGRVGLISGNRDWRLRTTEGVVCFSAMKTMTVSEAETGSARLLRWVASGEQVEIAEHQQPVAKVVPLRKPVATSLAGSVLDEGDLVSPVGVRWETAS